MPVRKSSSRNVTRRISSSEDLGSQSRPDVFGLYTRILRGDLEGEHWEGSVSYELNNKLTQASGGRLYYFRTPGFLMSFLLGGFFFSLLVHLLLPLLSLNSFFFPFLLLLSCVSFSLSRLFIFLARLNSRLGGEGGVRECNSFRGGWYRD